MVSSSQKKYNFNKGDYESCVSYDWSVMQDLNLVESWKYFAELIVDVTEKFVPVSKVQSDALKREPYLTQQCKDAIKIKHRKWKKFKYCKTDENYSAYKIERNKVVSELRKSKYCYEKDLAARIKTDNKLFWSHVRAKTKTKSTLGALENRQGNLTSDETECANILNEYFASVFEVEEDDQIPEFEERNYDSALTDIEINKDQISKIINALKPNKSQGPDRIHPRILKETNQCITSPLEKIFRKSLEEGILPDDWKSANVTAIHKNGDRKKAENYRPISLTSVAGKAMEKIIRDKLVNHMERNNLFNKSQHGFVSGRSCTTQLLEFMEEATQALDRGEDVDVIYLDFAKAFDKVPHKRLLKKLSGYGIKGKVYNWIKEFLSNRKQRVVINGIQSEWRKVTSGIPQGSVLGPILFLIYINDMPEVLNCCMKLFADDAKLYSPIKEENDRIRMQVGLKNAEEWAKIWKMFFHIKKCKYLHIGKNHPDTQYIMSEDQNPTKVTHVTSEKDLGVIFDEKLIFRDHISKKAAIANRNLGLIFRSFTYIDKDMFLNLYKSLVRPHLEYATSVWSPMFKKDSITLENVQRRATRLVNSLSGRTYEDRLKTLGLPTLEYRRLRADVIQVYKILNQIDRVDIDKFFTMSELSTRGNSLKIFKPRSRLKVRSSVFSNRVVDVWNSLPNAVVTAPSLNAFKSRLNKHWHGHELKFNAPCYIPGETMFSNFVRRCSNGSLEVA